MDLIYKIYSVYLYDNQLNHEYFILNKRSKGFTGELKWDLPYGFSGSSPYGALNIIYNMKGDDKKEKSIEIMRETSIQNKLPFIKNDGFLTLVKTGKSHIDNYNTYDIYWNETKSGINLHDWEVLNVWTPGTSSYSCYRIWEEKTERESQIRDYKLQLILNN